MPEAREAGSAWNILLKGIHQTPASLLQYKFLVALPLRGTCEHIYYLRNTCSSDLYYVLRTAFSNSTSFVLLRVAKKVPRNLYQFNMRLMKVHNGFYWPSG